MYVCVIVLQTVIGGESEARTNPVGSQIRHSQCKNKDLTIWKNISSVNLVHLAELTELSLRPPVPPSSDSITETSGLQVVSQGCGPRSLDWL